MFEQESTPPVESLSERDTAPSQVSPTARSAPRRSGRVVAPAEDRNEREADEIVASLVRRRPSDDAATVPVRPPSRIRRRVDAAPVVSRMPVTNRIQRRVVNDTDDAPLPDPELHRIRRAIDAGDPAARDRSLRRLQDMIDDDTRVYRRADVLALLRLPPARLPTPGHVAGAEPAEFLDLFGRSGRASAVPTVYFARRDATIDGNGEAALNGVLPTLTRPVLLRGYFSEDEDGSVALARAEAVARFLRQHGASVIITVESTTEGTPGNLEYRPMRRVEILDAATAPPVRAATDGRVRSTDARYANYGVAQALTDAERLIEGGIRLLGGLTPDTPTTVPAMATFRRFFTTADPRDVVARLRQALAQIPFYRPEAPDGDRGSGHACYDETRPGILFLNQGRGSQARMIVGCDALAATAGNRAYNVVHEATHGAFGTVDRAYRWQQLFPHLTPAEQFINADSYGLLIGVLGGLLEQPHPTTGAPADLPEQGPSTADTHGLDPADVANVKTSWGWLEHYVTQIWLNLRDLYPAVAAGLQLIPDSFQDRLHGAVLRCFKLPPPAFASIAGIIDCLDDLKQSILARPVVFYRGTVVPNVPGLVPVCIPDPVHDLRAMIDYQLWWIVKNEPNIAGVLIQMFRDFVRAVVEASDWGGPLSR